MSETGASKRGRRFRRWLYVALVVPMIGVLAFGSFIAWVYTDAKVDNVGEVEFGRRLIIPELAESRLDAQGRRVFDLTMAPGETDLGREDLTKTWGINGSYLGPTIRATRGETVVMNVENRLPEPSSLHWHGMHLPALMDGGPHQMIPAGDTWSPSWKIDQPAATLWYHPHPHGDTAEHVYRGLAGVFLIDEPAGEGPTGLPSEYGVDDVPVVVQDKRFDGSDLDLTRGLFSSTGILGDEILVNGTPGPYFDVTTERVRLRLVNASNARVYNFSLDDGREFQLVGSDGGLLADLAPLDHMVLSPGERAEIVVELAPGEDVTLRSGPLERASRFDGTSDSFDVLELRAAYELEQSADLPTALAQVPAPDALKVDRTRSFVLEGTDINGLEMDMSRVDATVTLGTTEQWNVKNTSGGHHNLHIHDVQFVVKSINGEPPPPELAGWKDTIYLPKDTEVELVMSFTDYADPDSPYMFHCHLLLHEDNGMMGQFVVTEPGEAAGTPLPVPESHEH